MRAPALAAALIVVLGASRAAAQLVTVRCARLEPEQRAELRARIRLALRSAPQGAKPLSVSLQCDAEQAHLLWEGAFREQIPIDETDGLLDGALDALERRLERPAAATRPGAAPGRRIAPPPAPPPRPRLGGLGLGVRFGPIAGPIAVGPRLDLALPAGAVSLIAVGSFRSAPDDCLLVGGELGLALGAPYRSDWYLGVAASGGIEALTALSSDGGPDDSRWAHAPVVSLGPRGAWTFARTTLWLGIDYRRRLQALSIEQPDVTIGRDEIAVSLGVLFGLDLSHRRRR